MSKQKSKTITIVGGGFTGSTIAIQQVQYYRSLVKQGHVLPPLTIRIIDEHGAFGHGLPYGTKDDVFLLNQPAYAMSPFPNDTSHFTKWLGGNGNEFATRQKYGAYLKETLHKTFNDAAAEGIEIRLETLSCHVMDLACRKNIVTLCSDDHSAFNSQAVILATGHQKSDFLRKFEGNKHFFFYSYSMSDVKDALETSTSEDNVAIVGTGQSMMDTLAVLDKVNYKGTIYAFSRHGVEPWAFNPQNYLTEKKPYKPFFLDPQRIKTEQAYSSEVLCSYLYHEFGHARKQGYDIGHVLAAIDFEALSRTGAAGKKPEGFTELHNLWSKIYGNPTPPERYRLFKKLKKEGRLKLVRGEILEGDIKLSDNGFVINTQKSGQVLQINVLFNAASYSREPLKAPLLQKAASINALHVSGSFMAAVEQQHPRLFVAGPSTNPHKWGVETFRDNNAVVAKQSVDIALNLNKR